MPVAVPIWNSAPRWLRGVAKAVPGRSGLGRRDL